LHIRGADEPLKVALVQQTVLGRTDPDTGDAPDVILDAYGAADLGVSRRHARLIADEIALRVEDLGSANHSFINGQKLVAHEPRILRDGDELRLGHLIMHIRFS
jgi:pSer/pThr/pTyr-binding forkhead associated (FHA) protein